MTNNKTNKDIQNRPTTVKCTNSTNKLLKVNNAYLCKALALFTTWYKKLLVTSSSKFTKYRLYYKKHFYNSILFILGRIKYILITKPILIFKYLKIIRIMIWLFTALAQATLLILTLFNFINFNDVDGWPATPLVTGNGTSYSNLTDFFNNFKIIIATIKATLSNIYDIINDKISDILNINSGAQPQEFSGQPESDIDQSNLDKLENNNINSPKNDNSKDNTIKNKIVNSIDIINDKISEEPAIKKDYKDTEIENITKEGGSMESDTNIGTYILYFIFFSLFIGIVYIYSDNIIDLFNSRKEDDSDKGSGPTDTLAKDSVAQRISNPEINKETLAQEPGHTIEGPTRGSLSSLSWPNISQQQSNTTANSSTMTDIINTPLSVIDENLGGFIGIGGMTKINIDLMNMIINDPDVVSYFEEKIEHLESELTQLEEEDQNMGRATPTLAQATSLELDDNSDSDSDSGSATPTQGSLTPTQRSIELDNEMFAIAEEHRNLLSELYRTNNQFDPSNWTLDQERLLDLDFSHILTEAISDDDFNTIKFNLNKVGINHIVLKSDFHDLFTIKDKINLLGNNNINMRNTIIMEHINSFISKHFVEGPATPMIIPSH